MSRLSAAVALVALVCVAAAATATGGGIFSPGALHAGDSTPMTLQGVTSHAALARHCDAATARRGRRAAWTRGASRVTATCVARWPIRRRCTGTGRRLGLRHVPHGAPGGDRAPDEGRGVRVGTRGVRLLAGRASHDVGWEGVRLQRLPWHRVVHCLTRRAASRAIATIRERSSSGMCESGGTIASPVTTVATDSREAPSRTTRRASGSTGGTPRRRASRATPRRARWRISAAPDHLHRLPPRRRRASWRVRRRLRRVPFHAVVGWGDDGARRVPARPWRRGAHRVQDVSRRPEELRVLHLLQLPRALAGACAGRASRRGLDAQPRRLRSLPSRGREGGREEREGQRRRGERGEP